MVGRNTATAEGGLAAGTFTANLTVQADGNVGIGTSTPTSPLHVAGAFTLPHTQLGANTTLGDAHYTVRCGPGCAQLTLPSAAGRQGRIYVLINSLGNTSGAVTLTPVGSQIVYDDTTGGTITALPVGSRLTIQSDGGNWVVLGR